MSAWWRYSGYPSGSGLRELVCKVAEADIETARMVQSVDRILKLLCDPDSAFNDTEISRYQDRYQPFWNWAEKALNRFPRLANFQLGLHSRNIGFALHFALSARVRQETRYPKPAPTDPKKWSDPITAFDDIVSQAFGDAPVICDGVNASQGAPIGFMSEAIVEELGTCIAALEFKEIEENLNEFIEMGHARYEEPMKIYKSSFIEFREFFQRMADEQSYVLAVFD